MHESACQIFPMRFWRFFYQTPAPGSLLFFTDFPKVDFKAHIPDLSKTSFSHVKRGGRLFGEFFSYPSPFCTTLLD